MENSTKMKILGFDISSACTGWAFLNEYEGEQKWTHGKIIFPKYYKNRTVSFKLISINPARSENTL